MAEGWRVIGQRSTERYMPNGQFEDVAEVTVQTERGTTRTFVVPAGMYSATYVKALVDEWVEREKAVHEL